MAYRSRRRYGRRIFSRTRVIVRRSYRRARRGYSAVGARRKMAAGAILMLIAIMCFPKVRAWIFKQWIALGLPIKGGMG